ncbi:19237_t:CDS:2 [Racocetra fulgida]|uniref:19237_t:CDS:1 n=1 Tax=Racocetra fulgida TaxID=60492 RepID=A0A9N9APR3_9GLOM|nr:19237_t:CDS:2 [Racocetra fulgida]
MLSSVNSEQLSTSSQITEIEESSPNVHHQNQAHQANNLNHQVTTQNQLPPMNQNHAPLVNNNRQSKQIVDHSQLVLHHRMQNNNPQPIHQNNNNFYPQPNNPQHSFQFNDLPQPNPINDRNRTQNNNPQPIQPIQQNNCQLQPNNLNNLQPWPQPNHNDSSQPNQLVHDRHYIQNNNPQPIQQNSFQPQTIQNNVHPNQSLQQQMDQVKMYLNAILVELGSNQISRAIPSLYGLSNSMEQRSNENSMPPATYQETQETTDNINQNQRLID